MYLIKKISVYSPEFLGEKDIFIAGEKIIAIKNNIETKSI